MGFEKLATLKQQFADEAKAAQRQNTAKAAKTTAPKTPAVDPVVLIIGKLQKLFPKTFPKNPAPKVPLKVGILKDLVAQSETIKIAEEDIKLALKTWCRGARYWAVTVEGAERIDLDGQSAGSVSATEANQAKMLASRRRAPNKKADDAPPQNATPETSQ